MTENKDATEGVNEAYLMTDALVKRELKVYKNGAQIFGQCGVFFFRYLEKEQAIIQLNANNNIEMKTYLNWKFNQKSKALEENDPLFLLLGLILRKNGLF